MSGAILGALFLGSAVLGGVDQPVVTGFQPAWALNVNAIIQVKRIDP